jgi:small subunit ribosomal protein S11
MIGSGSEKDDPTTQVAIAHVRVTSNNIMVSIANRSGDAICWASAGSCGFKGARRSTFLAGLATAQRSAARARELGIKSVEIRVKGEGPGAEGAIAGLEAGGLRLIRKP